MLDAEGAASPNDIRAALVAGAAPVGAFGPCAVGAGLVDAVAAIEEVEGGATATGPACEAPQSEVDPEEAAAAGSWGSEAPPSLPPSTTTTPSGSGTVENPVLRVLPRTFFLQRPAKLLRTRRNSAKAVFRFGSDEEGVSFVCRVDGGFFRPCPARLTRRFLPGWHVISVAARDAAGNGDRSPATYHFKVKRIG
jgi:hypothetical protein